MNNLLDEKYMTKAFKQALKSKNDVPVGAIIVYKNKIIAKSHNERELKKDPSAHAEILALRKAAKKLNRWKLNECIMYVTLEPCIMCAGAIINARIKKVYFGAYDKKFGAVVSLYNLLDGKNNHKTEYEGGILGKKCGKIISLFFKKIRKNKKLNELYNEN